MTTEQYGRRQIPTPDWRGIARANSPALVAAVPMLSEPRENANVILNKQVATMNRAGSNPGNPILAGLGVRIQLGIGVGDFLKGLYLYQNRDALGANLVGEVAHAGQYATFDFMAGSGRTVSGDHASGAAKNFLRVASDAGTYERQLWIKSPDPDIVTANGQACLDASLNPIEIPLTIVNISRQWIDVDVDFMPSWNDEFGVLARADSQQVEAGFKKPYGGALFVSFFDKTPGTEGVGVQVNPITQAQISTVRSIQIENTAGTKDVTVRFRSRQDAGWFVDVNIRFVVTAPDVEACNPPFSEPCSAVYLKAGTPCPANCPAVASVPGVQVTAGTPGAPLAQDLLVVTIHGTTVGASPKIRVREWLWVANAKALAGADLQQIGLDQDYLPYVQTGDSPVEAPPYGSPHRLTIAFSVVQLKNDLVALLEATVIDGDDVSPPIAIPGPKARDIGLLPIGGTGGSGDDICAY